MCQGLVQIKCAITDVFHAIGNIDHTVGKLHIRKLEDIVCDASCTFLNESTRQHTGEGFGTHHPVIHIHDLVVVGLGEQSGIIEHTVAHHLQALGQVDAGILQLLTFNKCIISDPLQAVTQFDTAQVFAATKRKGANLNVLVANDHFPQIRAIVKCCFTDILNIIQANRLDVAFGKGHVCNADHIFRDSIVGDRRILHADDPITNNQHVLL